MQRNVNQTHSKKKLSVFIVIIAVLAVALGAAVWISDNGKKGWIDVNADIGADKLSKIQLEAKSPVEFPKDPIVVTQSIEKDSAFEKGVLDGTFKYVIKNVEIYDNLQDAKIAISDLPDSLGQTRARLLIRGFDGKKAISIPGSYVLDGRTGKFIDDCYLLIFELDITNIDVMYYESDSIFDYLNTDIFRTDGLFKLYIYNENFEEDSYASSANGYVDFDVIYIKETAKEETGILKTFKAPKGKTTTIHIGFIVLDNSTDAFTKVGLQFCDQPINECIEKDHIYWFNMSKMIEDYKNSRG